MIYNFSNYKRIVIRDYNFCGASVSFFKFLKISPQFSNIFIEKNLPISGPTQFKPMLFESLRCWVSDLLFTFLPMDQWHNHQLGLCFSILVIHRIIAFVVFKKCIISRDFPGGRVVKNLPYSAGDAGSIPGLETKIPRGVGQLSPRATTTELARPN